MGVFYIPEGTGQPMTDKPDKVHTANLTKPGECPNCKRLEARIAELSGALKAQDIMQNEQINEWREKLHIPDHIVASSDIVDDLCEYLGGRIAAAEGKLEEITEYLTRLRDGFSEGLKQPGESLHISKELTKSIIDVLDGLLAMLPGPWVCEWVYDEQYDCWDTKCGNSFCYNDGGPEENGQKYCGYCGRQIKVEEMK
jgi:hypothetical protein